MPDGTTLATAKISELPVAPSANATDKLEASQVDTSLGFVSRSITVGQVATVVAGTLPTTLPPSGAASGDLAGSYPAPTIKASVGLTGTPTAPTAVPSTTNTTQIATTAFVQSALPTTLPGPPTGIAGGGLSGSYPNPTIRPSTTNGDVLTTVAGAAAWAAPTGGGGGTATLATGAVGYGSGTNVLTGVLADFSWDASLKRLGVGTGTPGALAHFNSATAGTKALIVRGTTTSASQDYFDVILTDPTGGGGSAMRVMGGATGINPLFQVDRAGDTQVSGWLRVLSTSGLVTNGADYFGAMLGNGAGGNLGTFAGLGAPTFSTFGSYGSLYLNGSSPGLPYYNSNGTTGWDRLVGETSTQTLSNKTFGATTFTGTGPVIAASNPATSAVTMQLRHETAPTDQKTWDFLFGGNGDFAIRAVSDSGGTASDVFRATRGAGTAVANATITPPINFAGTANVTGALTGTTATFNAGASTPGLRVNGNDAVLLGLFSGATKGLRITTSSTGSIIDGVDNTGTGSFQPLNLNGSLVNIAAPLTGGLATFTGTVMAPGAQIQMVSVQNGTMSTLTTLIPVDNTIPQITEGTEVMTLAITPKSATSRLNIDVTVNCAASVGGNVVAALFQDSTANALAANSVTPGVNANVILRLNHTMTSGTTSATTLRVRLGLQAAGTLTFNGNNGAAFFGGTWFSSIVIREVAP